MWNERWEKIRTNKRITITFHAHNNTPNMHNTYCCKCRTKVLGPFNSYLRGYLCVSCAATHLHLLLRSFHTIFRYRCYFCCCLPPSPYVSVWTISCKISVLQNKIRRRNNATNWNNATQKRLHKKLFTVSLFTCVNIARI